MPSIKVLNLVSGANRREELWECIGHFELVAWNIQDISGGFFIVTEEGEYESYFVEEVTEHFNQKVFCSPCSPGARNTILFKL